MIGREPKAVHQQLTAVKRTEIGGQRIAEPDNAEQFVVEGIGDRYGVRELLRGIHAVAMTDRNVGIGGSARDLSGQCWHASGKPSTHNECVNSTFHYCLLAAAHDAHSPAASITPLFATHSVMSVRVRR